ncbi:hypothetical protein QVD17_18931 [Tagetes erecta]|uniref:Uncharacterized protein n=1 Tax=Tagetes erecta TaxID=13708 RepID=A0AAD8KQ22_TARER|nr:hypothetical protein QVD17_18931 [Tagetes erecta]
MKPHIKPLNKTTHPTTVVNHETEAKVAAENRKGGVGGIVATDFLRLCCSVLDRLRRETSLEASSSLIIYLTFAYINDFKL